MLQRTHGHSWCAHFGLRAGIALACGIITISYPAYSDTGRIEWRKSTPLPEPRADCAMGVIDGKLILAGGTYWDGTKGNWIRKRFSASVHAFDVKTEQWERLPDLPFPLSSAASTVVNQRLYVLGGYTGEHENRQILLLHKEGDTFTWTTAGEIPDTRLFAWAGTVGNSLYVLGGVRRFEPLDAKGTCCTSATGTNQLMAWDTSADTVRWEEKAPHPGGKRWLFGAATDGNFIWMFGGRDSDTPQQEPVLYRDLLEYSIAENTWRSREPLPQPVADTAPLSSVYRDGQLLMISFFKTVWQLDLATGHYSQQSLLPEETMVDRFFWIDGQLVGAGGENKIESPRRRSEWTFIGLASPR